MLENLRIRARLLLLVGILVLLTAVVMGMGLRGMAASNAGLHTVYEDRTVPLMQLNAVTHDLGMIQTAIMRLAYTGDKAGLQRNADEIGGLNRDIDTYWEHTRPPSSLPKSSGSRRSSKPPCPATAPIWQGRCAFWKPAMHRAPAPRWRTG